MWHNTRNTGSRQAATAATDSSTSGCCSYSRSLTLPYLTFGVDRYQLASAEAVSVRERGYSGLDSSDTMGPLQELGKDFSGYVCMYVSLSVSVCGCE